MIQEPFIHVEDIVKEHWVRYGRNFYCRYDYEGVQSTAAQSLMNHLRSLFSSLPGQTFGSYIVSHIDLFLIIASLISL